MTVDELMAQLDEHPFVDEVNAFRRTLLDADDRLTETWKWNAPNFRFDGEDRITFRLRPGMICQLILHRGARVRDDEFAFDDDSGWIEWKSPDRGVVAFADPAQLVERQDALVQLCLRWCASTT